MSFSDRFGNLAVNIYCDAATSTVLSKPDVVACCWSFLSKRCKSAELELSKHCCVWKLHWLQSHQLLGPYLKPLLPLTDSRRWREAEPSTYGLAGRSATPQSPPCCRILDNLQLIFESIGSCTIIHSPERSFKMLKVLREPIVARSGSTARLEGLADIVD